MTGMTGMKRRLLIPTSHPSLPGHFPGQPVVPGVVLLDEVVALACEHHPGTRLESLASVKFLSPLLPDQECEISIETAEASLNFTVTRNGATLAKGRLRLAAADEGAQP